MPLANSYDKRRAETPINISAGTIRHNVYREEVNFRNVEYWESCMGNSEVYFKARMNKDEKWTVKLVNISDDEVETFNGLNGKFRNSKKDGRTFTIDADNDDVIKAIKIHLNNKDAAKIDYDTPSFWHRR